MKKYFILAISLFILSHTFAQDINELDQKNGFKEYFFGQDKREFEQITRQVLPNLLEYTGKKYSELFDIYWYNLQFAFCNNKLYTIIIDFDYANEYKYNKLLESLEKLFGKSYTATNTQLKNNKWKRYNSWENGKNVYMYIRFLDDDYPKEKNCETCNIQLEIGSDKLEKECLKSNF